MDDRMMEPGLGGGLSSNNGVSSLLQQIEQSEKSQAGDTEQNDYFLDYINNDFKGTCQPSNSLFVTNPANLAAGAHTQKVATSQSRMYF